MKTEILFSFLFAVFILTGCNKHHSDPEPGPEPPGPEPEEQFSLSTGLLVFNYIGEAAEVNTFTITCDTDWTLTKLSDDNTIGGWEKEEWVSLDKSSGTGNSTVTATILSLNPDKTRNAEFQIKTYQEVLKIVIRQNSANIQHYIPDDTFRAYCLAMCDSDRDGELSLNEAQRFERMDFYGYSNLKSLKGIEHFTQLRILECVENQLTELDLSANNQLTSVKCWSNNLSELNVRGTTELRELYCEYNQLTELDISGNAFLEELWCYGNALTTVDLSSNPRLKVAFLQKNKLPSFECVNPALISLSVDENPLSRLDVAGSPLLKSLQCSYTEITELDLSSNTALTRLECKKTFLKELDLTGCKSLEFFDASGNPYLETVYLSEGMRVGYYTDGHTKIVIK